MILPFQDNYNNFYNYDNFSRERLDLQAMYLNIGDNIYIYIYIT